MRFGWLKLARWRESLAFDAALQAFWITIGVWWNWLIPMIGIGRLSFFTLSCVIKLVTYHRTNL